MFPKKIKKIIAIVAGILLATIVFIMIFWHSETKPKVDLIPNRLNDYELGKLEAGNIVLRKGYGAVSHLMETRVGSHGVSHCGILVGKLPDFEVIHSLSDDYSNIDGVQKCSLNEFLDNGYQNSFVAIKHKNSNLDRIVFTANKYLDLQIPFDLKFDPLNHDKIFCSELIYLIIKDASNQEIFNLNNFDFLFDVFFDTIVFERIIDQRVKKTSIGSSNK